MTELRTKQQELDTITVRHTRKTYSEGESWICTALEGAQPTSSNDKPAFS